MRRSTKPDTAQKFKYITPQISFYKILQKQREVEKKQNLSQESHGGNIVRSVKFLFSALSHSLSKPFLFWKVPHTGAPRDPPAVLVARGSHCMTFSCSWPSPASDLLQTGLQLGSLHTYNYQMNPEEPTRGLSNYANRDKALYSTRTCRDPVGSWHGWDGQLYQQVQNTPTHTHTQHLRLLHFTSLPMPTTLRALPLPTYDIPTSEGYTFIFCRFFSDFTW